MRHSSTFSLAADTDAARLAAERLFEEVKRLLVPILPAAAEILHVGATSVPGCLTKGDLDIVTLVDRADYAVAEKRLAALFPRNIGSVRTVEFAAFEDAGWTPHLGIQLTAKGGAFDHFHRFTDALRGDPALVRQYNALKLAQHGRSMNDYRAAKDAFVEDVLQRFLRGKD